MKQQGFTLIELMIAMFLSIVMLGGAYNIFISNFKSYQMLVSDSHIQESARIARSLLVKDIQLSNALGCHVTNQGYVNEENYMNSTTHPDFDLQFFEGFSLVNNSSAQSIKDAVKFHTSGDSTKVEVGTDVLTLSRARGVASQVTAAEVGSTEFTVTGDYFSNGDYIVVKTCYGGVVSEMFQVQTAASVAGGGQTLTVDNEIFGNYLNSDGVAKMGVSIYKLEAVSYFVSKSASSGTGDTKLSLFRKVNNDAAEEFIAGVDDLQVAYQTSDGTTSSYSRLGTATQVVQAGNVDVTLVLRSDTTKNASQFTGPDFGKTAGAAYTDDGKLRRIFTVSGKVRS